MPTLQSTANRNYPKPHIGNPLDVDVERIRSALEAIDVDAAALFAGLGARAPLASPAFTGAPTAPTPTSGDDSGKLATTAFVRIAVALAIDNLLGGAPGALDTLNELAAALGDDPNFAATVNAAIAARLVKSQNLGDLPDKPQALTNLGFSAFMQTLKAMADAATLRSSLGVAYSDLPWLAVPISGVILLDTSLVGTVEPPTNSTLYRFAKLTAGLTGSGAYNNGVLSGESTSGSAPLVVSSATVALSGSPINGQTISLLNTEGRYLKPGTSPGTVENDHIQEHYHSSVRELDGQSLPTGTNGVYSVMSRGGTLYNGVATSGVVGARVATSTDVKRRQVTAYMRVK